MASRVVSDARDPREAVARLAEADDAVARAPLGFRVVHWFLRLLIRLFFREVEVVGLEHVPPDRGGVVVSWHPNGLVDPGLILTGLPRRIVFGARNGLFKWPLLGRLMRSIGTVPIHRNEDETGGDPDLRRARNAESLDGLAHNVAAGRLTALFPEGLSHDAPHPMELRTGAARLFEQARALQPEGAPPPVILPVGLHYDEKRLFRSRAVVRFHPPMTLPEELESPVSPDASEPVLRDRARILTSEIGKALHDVVLALEDWETHHLLRRAGTLLRAEASRRGDGGAGPNRLSPARFSEVARELAGLRAAYLAQRARDPARASALRDRLKRYDAELRSLGLEDHEIDPSVRLGGTRVGLSLAAQVMALFFLLPPLLVLGYLVNGPAALVLLTAAKAAAKDQKDEATIKVLGGAVLFPLTWAAVGVAGALGYIELHAHFPGLPDIAVLYGMLLALVAAVGGALALRYLNMASETLRALRVRFTRARRRDVLDRLVAERGALYDALAALQEGPASARATAY